MTITLPSVWGKQGKGPASAEVRTAPQWLTLAGIHTKTAKLSTENLPRRTQPVVGWEGMSGRRLRRLWYVSGKQPTNQSCHHQNPARSSDSSTQTYFDTWWVRWGPRPAGHSRTLFHGRLQNQPLHFQPGNLFQNRLSSCLSPWLASPFLG